VPRVAIVLPVYNHARYVEQTLQSLYAQDFRDFEILAVDDGSTDNTLEILNRHCARIRIIQSEHKGPAAARNQALIQTDSEYVAFMDADDVCTSNRLRVELQELETKKRDLVASALSFIDANGAALPGAWRRPPDAANDYWGALLERNWIGTPSVLARRRVLLDAGLFDERFTHAEDYDLWLRLGASSRFAYIDTPLIQCRRHSGNTSNDMESHQAFERLALQKVDAAEARSAFVRLYRDSVRSEEAWIWFLLRSGNAQFREDAGQALSLFPGSHLIRFALGVFHHDCGEWDEARAVFEALSESDTASRHNAGVLSWLCGDYKGADRFLSQALGARPDYDDARFNLTAMVRGQRLRLTRRPFRQDLVPMIRG
jgi:glycosyltransferase involved in cell wall biosynthesis